MEEFTERDGEIIRSFRYKPETSVFFNTARQRVCILDTVLYGRTLFLDGILQSSEKDEELYHRMLVHPIFGTDTDVPKTVLIIGGGEGATLREVLKWKDVESVTMLDWDEELVTYFREKESTWHRGAFQDPRVHLEFADIFHVIDQNRSYDRILVDLVDPDMNDERWRSFFHKLVGWLAPKGQMNINAGGVYPWDDGDVPAIEEVLRESMEGKEAYQLFRNKKWVPSFGREWAFVILKKV